MYAISAHFLFLGFSTLFAGNIVRAKSVVRGLNQVCIALPQKSSLPFAVGNPALLGLYMAVLLLVQSLFFPKMR